MHYKVEKVLLQSVVGFLYYKMRQLVVQSEAIFITKRVT